MATITVAIKKSHGDIIDLIPVSVLKSLPEAELIDRLSYFDDLAARPCDSQLREGYALHARAMLGAQPRESVEKAVAQYHAQALRTPDARRAEALRSEAARLLERNPIAPRQADVARSRVIAKAKASAGLVAACSMPPGKNTAAPRRAGVAKGLQVAVYDHRGRLTGCMDPARIRQRVAKADAEKPAQVAVYDDKGNLAGVCDADAIKPLATPKPAIGNPADMTPAPPADAGTPAADVAEIAKAAAELKHTFYHGDPAAQNRAAAQMQTLANASLAAIHGRGSQARPRPGRGR